MGGIFRELCRGIGRLPTQTELVNYVHTMEMRPLRYFVAVAENLNFTNAGAGCCDDCWSIASSMVGFGETEPRRFLFGLVPGTDRAG